MSDSGYVTIDGAKLWYESGGAGETLILIHAGITDSRMWDDQWDAFTRQYRVIRYDQRGFGRSDPAVGPVSPVDDLLQLMDALGVERAALLGCSLGGEVVIDAVLAHPERVTALILVSTVPAGFEMRGGPPRYLLEMMEAAQQGDLERASDLQLRIYIDGPKREPDQVNASARRRAAEIIRLPAEQDLMGSVDAEPANALNPPAARLKEIRVPALIMGGMFDDPEILRGAAFLTNEIPGAEKVILDAAHLPNLEQPRVFNEKVLEFLAEL